MRTSTYITYLPRPIDATDAAMATQEITDIPS